MTEQDMTIITGLRVSMVSSSFADAEDLPDEPGILLCGSIDAIRAAGALLGEDVSVSVSSDLVATLLDCAEAAEAKLTEWQQSQQYRYIGKDGKPVLARALEDRAEAAEAEVERMREALEAPAPDQKICHLSALDERIMSVLGETWLSTIDVARMMGEKSNIEIYQRLRSMEKCGLIVRSSYGKGSRPALWKKAHVTDHATLRKGGAAC